MGRESRNISHIIVNESGIFVTTVAPKIIRTHIDDIRSTGSSRINSNVLYNLCFQDHTYQDASWRCKEFWKLLNNDFLQDTYAVKQMKETFANAWKQGDLYGDLTLWLLIPQIERMLADAVPCSRIGLYQVGQSMSGIHSTKSSSNQTFNLCEIGVLCFINVACAFTEYNAGEFWASIKYQLEKEQSLYNYTWSPFEEQLYLQASKEYEKSTNAAMKACGGLVLNSFNAIGQGIKAKNSL